MSGISDCKFGPIEYDGARYCHEHCSFMEVWHEIRNYCPKAVELIRACRRANSSSPQADSAPRGEDTPSALSRDTATAEGVPKLPASMPGETVSSPTHR